MARPARLVSGLLALTCVLAACSQTQPADDSAAPARAPTLQADDVARAATPMVAAAEPAEPGTDNLCAPGEPVIFSCRVTSGKMLSVCAAAEEGGPRFAQYRFGTPGEESELLFPQERADGALGFASVPYSGGGEAQLSFTRAGTDYVVYSRVIRTGFGAEGNNPLFEDGVLVMKDGKTLADRRCGPDGLQSIDYDKAQQYAEEDKGREIVYPE